MNRVLIEDVAPRAWDAICDLLRRMRIGLSIFGAMGSRDGATALLLTLG